MLNHPMFAGLPEGQLYRDVALAAMIAVGSIVMFLRRGNAGRKSSRVAIAVSAFFAGPIIGVLIATVGVMFGDTESLDRPHLFASIVSIGFISGSIAAFLVGVFAGEKDAPPPDGSL